MNTDFTSLEGKQKEHFNFAHLGLIALCAVFLTGLTVMKTGLTLKKVVDPDTKQMTYEDALKLAVEKIKLPENLAQSDQNLQDEQTKLALVDPNINGQVAGASIEAGQEILDLDATQKEVFDLSQKISIKILSLESPEAFAVYREYIETLELENFAAESFSAVGSKDDKESLKKASLNLEKLISFLGDTEVPKEFADFHRLKVFYYGTMKALAENYLLSNPDEAENEQFTKYFFATSSELEKQKKQISQKYGFELP